METTGENWDHSSRLGSRLMCQPADAVEHAAELLELFFQERRLLVGSSALWKVDRLKLLHDVLLLVHSNFVALLFYMPADEIGLSGLPLSKLESGHQRLLGVVEHLLRRHAIFKQCSASRQDRRTALELAVIVDAVQKAGSAIRWTPHQRMPVDMLTKVDMSKTNGTLLHLLRTGQVRIDKEDVEMLRRQRDESARSRTRRSSDRLLEAEELYFMTVVSNTVWST